MSATRVSHPIGWPDMAFDEKVERELRCRRRRGENAAVGSGAQGSDPDVLTRAAPPCRRLPRTGLAAT